MNKARTQGATSPVKPPVITTSPQTSIATKKATEPHTIKPFHSRKRLDERQVECWHNSSILANTISQEFLLAVSLNLANTALELLRPKYDIYIILGCSLLIGFLKGVIKSAADLLTQKDASSFTMLGNCFFEVLTELTAELILHFSGKKLNIAELNFAKSMFKNSLKWFIKNESLRDEKLQDFLKAFLNLIIFREIIATLTSTILITTVSSAFIESSLFIIKSDKLMTSPRFSSM